MTGLSGTGKSASANVLLERGGRRSSLLDSDLVRRHLSNKFGFSREHRDLDIRCIGFVASEIARHGGLAICAPNAPYDTTRTAVREMVETTGREFALVHIATSFDVAEARDPKGLYAKAQAGIIPEFTDISDPYEPSGDTELVIETSGSSPRAAADQIIGYLEAQGYYSKEFWT